MPRRKVPRRYRDAFSPEHALPGGVEYIPYRHAVSQAKRRLQRTPLAYLALAAAWIVVASVELVTGSPRQPLLLGGMVVTLAAFAAWNLVTLLRIRRGHPSSAVWRYGLFLWPDALVVLPTTGRAVVVPIGSITSVQQDREAEANVARAASSRVVRVRAVAAGGEPVSVTIDDLGAMPAQHLVRAIETWRTGVAPELLAAAETAGASTRRFAR